MGEVKERMYAEWTDVEARVREAVESALLDGDPHDGPPLPSEVEWASRVADQVVQTTMMHLDGYTAEDARDR